MNLAIFYLYSGERDHLKISLEQSRKITDVIYIFTTRDFFHDAIKEFIGVEIRLINWEFSFSAARNAAIEIIQMERRSISWIMYLDSDECIDRRQAWRVVPYLEMYQNPNVFGFSLNIINNGSEWLSAVDENSKTLYTRELSSTPVRIFRADKGIKFHGIINETIDIHHANVQHLDIPIYHHAYRYTEPENRFLVDRKEIYLNWVYLNDSEKDDYKDRHQLFVNRDNKLIPKFTNQEKPALAFFCLHYDPPIGGAERSMHLYFKELQKYFSITAYCFLNDDGKKFNQLSMIERDGIKICKTPWPIERVVNDCIRNVRPSIIGTQLAGSDIVTELAFRHQIPCFKFIHSLFEDVCQHYLIDTCPHIDLMSCDFGKHCPNGQQMDRHLDVYKKCFHIYANSEYSKNVLKRFFPSIMKSVSILTPSFDQENYFIEQIEKSKVPTVLAVNSHFLKGRNVVINLARKNPNIRFVYLNVKDGDRPQLKKCSNIEMHGLCNQDEMRHWYNAADVVMFPSLMDETYGCVAAESVLCGTPVICSDKGNLPYLIKDGENGYVVSDFTTDWWNEKLHLALKLTINNSDIENFRKANSAQVEDLKKDLMECCEYMNESITYIPEKREKMTIRTNQTGKRVCFFAKFFYPPLGGGEYFIHAILSDLTKQGYDCWGAGYCDANSNKPFQSEKRVDWQGIPADQIVVRSAQDIENYYDREKPDLIITHSYDAPIIVDIAKKKKIKTVLGLHFWRNICDVPDNFVNMLDRPLESVKLLTESHRVFFEADSVYANSEFMQLAAKRYVDKDIDTVIYPVVNLERSIAKEKDPKYITLINPDYGKGGEVFIKIAQKMPNEQFMCVGLASEIIPINKSINARLNRMANVKVVAKTDDIAAIYAQTKILLVPSLVDETFSMVTVEAMANGIPILASPNGNLKYLLEGAGYLLNPDDIGMWIEAIKFLGNDKMAYDELSKEMKSISSKYDPEIGLSKFRNIVKELIGEK